MAITAATSIRPTTTELLLEIGWPGGSGTITVPRRDKLSAAGNVIYEAGIRKGLRLVGEPAEVLGSLTFTVNGDPMNPAASGVHTSQPRFFREGSPQAGRPIPGSGGKLTVCHTGFPTLPATGNATVGYQVQVFITYLGLDREGADRGYNLKVRAWPRPTNLGGPQVVGEVMGLMVS